MEGRGIGVDVGGRDAGAGVMGGFGLVVLVVEEGRERMGRERRALG